MDSLVMVSVATGAVGAASGATAAYWGIHSSIRRERMVIEKAREKREQERDQERIHVLAEIKILETKLDDLRELITQYKQHCPMAPEIAAAVQVIKTHQETCPVKAEVRDIQRSLHFGPDIG